MRIAWVRSATLLLIASASFACGDEIDAGGDGIDAGSPDDPLVFDEPAPVGSLDELQRDIIQERCSGEPGLCHNGQFEPNLSTTANTYAWMVERPSIENFDRLRVAPGDPDSSFLIDKLRDRNVGTQMPLGAEPLTEEEIARFESWIEDGALRAPDADPAVALNNPPKTPEFAVFVGGTRIDQSAPYTVPQDTTITLRHSVKDFETTDENVFLGAFVIGTSGGNLVLAPGVGNQDLGVSSFDATNPPMGTADVLNFEFDFTIGSTIDVVGPGGQVSTISSAGVVFNPIPLYIDLDPSAGGIIAVGLGNATFMVAN